MRILVLVRIVLIMYIRSVLFLEQYPLFLADLPLPVLFLDEIMAIFRKNSHLFLDEVVLFLVLFLVQYLFLAPLERF